MKFVDFEHNVLPRIIPPLIAGLLALAASHRTAHANSAPLVENNVFVVGAADGYGVTECIKDDRGCAKIVADAWCEAHGHAAALSFGHAADVTGSTGAAAQPAAPKDSVVISCGE